MTRTEMPAVELHRILADAIPFASREDMLPVINCVHLEAGGGHLVAAATDRFVLGASRAEYRGAKFELSLPLQHARTLERIARAPRSQHRTRKVALAYRAGGLTCSFSTGETITVSRQTTSRPKRARNGRFQSNSMPPFPAWRQLIPATKTHEPVPNIFGISPEKIARFSHVRGGYGQMQVFISGPAKIIAVRIGDDFVGGIMPIRLPDDTAAAWTRPQWLETPEAVEEKAS